QIIGWHELPFIRCSQLLLAQRFSCVVGDGVGTRLPGICRELRARKPQRVLHERSFNGVRYQSELRHIIKVEADFRVEIVTLGIAMLAVTVRLEMRGI